MFTNQRRAIALILVIVFAVTLMNIGLLKTKVSSTIHAQDPAGTLQDANTTLRKPGEPEGFVPTPLVDSPLPADVKPETPGQPAALKNRLEPKELEKLIPTPLPPDAPYESYVVLDIMPRDSKSSAFASQTIVIATVNEVYPAQWNTVDGKRPPNPHDPNNPGSILTRISLKVEQTLAGDAKPGQLFTLMENGGKIGEEELKVESPYPEFAVGQVLLLYLTFLDTPQLLVDQIWGMPDKSPMIWGRYIIDPASHLATSPFEQRSLDDLIAEINEVNQLKAKHFLPKP